MLNLINDYIANGWVLIPTHHKQPVIKYKKYQVIKPTMDDYKKWFSTWTGNVAVLAGELSGVCVIDFDSVEAINSHLELSGIETMTVKTNRGIHKYFRYPDKAKLSNMRLTAYPEIDFKVHNCLVTCPPSKHASGHIYTVISGSLDNLAPFPDQLIPLLVKKYSTSINRYQYQFPLLYDKLNDNIITNMLDKLCEQRKGLHYSCYKGHDKESLSLKAYPETNSYYCFGCHEGGGVIQLVMNAKKMTFSEAIGYLKNK